MVRVQAAGGEEEEGRVDCRHWDDVSEGAGVAGGLAEVSRARIEGVERLLGV